MALFSKEKVRCPVCKTYLGQRYKDELYMAHCDECKTEFTWSPKQEQPRALLDKNKPLGCNCGRCKE